MATSPAPPPAEWRLELKHPGAGMRTVPVPPGSLLRLGRSTDMDIHVRDHELIVSREHLVLHNLGDRLRVEIRGRHGAEWQHGRLSTGEEIHLQPNDWLNFGAWSMTARRLMPPEEVEDLLSRPDPKLGLEDAPGDALLDELLKRKKRP